MEKGKKSQVYSVNILQHSNSGDSGFSYFLPNLILPNGGEKMGFFDEKIT